MARNKRQYGTGRLAKRGSGWLIRWYETEMMQDGNTRRIQRNETLPGTLSRKEASAILAQRINASGSKPVLRSRTTFAEIASQWQETVVPMYKHSTALVHVHLLGKHILPRFGEMDVDKITRQEIQAWIAYLNRQFAPKTVDHLHDILSAVLRTAMNWGYISENPALGVEMPALKTVRPKFALTQEQVDQLLSRLPLLARTMVGLDILTGIRRGELFALRWKNVDWDARNLTINEAVYEGVFSSPKTNAGNRVIPLCDFAIDLLSEWRAATKSTSMEDLVFSTRFGKPLSPNNVLRRSVFPVCADLGLPNVTWLTFRRTYSSWAHDKGIPDKVIAKLMGHTNVNITLNVYTQVMDASLRVAAERIGSDFQLR